MDSAIDQIKIFLTKLAGISPQKFPEKEWEQLRGLQKIRNCIVHHYGVAKELGDADKKFLKGLASRHVGFSIGDDGRILITKSFCEQQLTNVRHLFEHLLETVGWAW